MQNKSQDAIDEMLKSFKYLLDEAFKKTTKIYNGIVVSSAGKDNKWNIKYNGETHAVKMYGMGRPKVNDIVKVIVPQGNQNLAWFFLPLSSKNNDKDKNTDMSCLPNFQKSYLQLAMATDNPQNIQPYFVVMNTNKKEMVYLSNTVNGKSYIGLLAEDRCSVKSYNQIDTNHANDITYSRATDSYYIADLKKVNNSATLLNVKANNYAVSRIELPFSSEIVACSYNENDNTFWAFGGEDGLGAFIYHISGDLKTLLSRVQADQRVYGSVGSAIVQGSFMYENKFVVVFNNMSKAIGIYIGAQLYTFDEATGKIDGRFNVDSMRGEIEGGYWDGKELRLCCYTPYKNAYMMYCYTLDAPVYSMDEECYVFLKDKAHGSGTNKDPSGNLAHALMTAQWFNSYVRVRLLGDINDTFPDSFMCVKDVCMDMAPASGVTYPRYKGKLNIHNGTYKFDSIVLEGVFQFKNSRVALNSVKLESSTDSSIIHVFGGTLTSVNTKFYGHSKYAVAFQLNQGAIANLHADEIVCDYNSAFFALSHGFCSYIIPQTTLTEPVRVYEDGIGFNKADWVKLNTV